MDEGLQSNTQERALWVILDALRRLPCRRALDFACRLRTWVETPRAVGKVLEDLMLADLAAEATDAEIAEAVVAEQISVREVIDHHQAALGEARIHPNFAMEVRVRFLLREGHTEADLTAASNAYHADCDARGIGQSRRQSAATFFDKHKGLFWRYLPQTETSNIHHKELTTKDTKSTKGRKEGE